MSSQTRARQNLGYVDPAEFTPHYSWKKRTGESSRSVYCEGVKLSAIAERFGTPVYVYSQKSIVESLTELRTGLGNLDHRICFAVKANGNLSILKLLARNSCGFDIVSGGELEHLGHIGIPGDRIVFSGVGKTREEIRQALRYQVARKAQRGILQFNIESEAELDVLLEESGRIRSGSDQLPAVSIRVNPDVRAGGHPHISTGLHEHKFGLSWPVARSLYFAHRESKFVQWQGISAHIGSQIVSLDPFRRALRRLASYLLELRQGGVHLKYLDFGGGLAVRYMKEQPASRRAYARMIAEVVRPLGVGLLLEPGRSIVASAGTLLARVIYVKRNSKKTFVIIDAAMNDMMRPVLYDAPHPITQIVQTGDARATTRAVVDVVGQVCETGDCFLQGWRLGEVRPNDVVAIWAAGAYGMSQASNYNARRRAAEVLVNGKSVKLIRRRETSRDLLRTDILA
ncbi:MAG: diaminopimelate decarboxylase [Candidatus Acidiferrum sp.]